jgi:hypothetical protein
MLKMHARNIYFLANSLTVTVFGNLPKILHFNKLFCILVKYFSDFFKHKLYLHKVLCGIKENMCELIGVSIWVILGRLTDKSQLYLV